MADKTIITGSGNIVVPAPAVESKGTLIISGSGNISIRVPKP